jgi:hypothetical protein
MTLPLLETSVFVLTTCAGEAEEAKGEGDGAEGTGEDLDTGGRGGPNET